MYLMLPQIIYLMLPLTIHDADPNPLSNSIKPPLPDSLPNVCQMGVRCMSDGCQMHVSLPSPTVDLILPPTLSLPQVDDMSLEKFEPVIYAIGGGVNTR